jgi:hypothetical protein
MKKLTNASREPRCQEQKTDKHIEKAEGKKDAKCCAKTSKNPVGCHD